MLFTFVAVGSVKTIVPPVPGNSPTTRQVFGVTDSFRSKKYFRPDKELTDALKVFAVNEGLTS